MADAAEKTEMTTNLTVPVELRDRILKQGEADRRPYKQEILVLLDEAVAARERKAK